MGSIFAQPPARAGLGETPAPRAALVAHGGAGLEALAGAATLCLGAEREGLPAEVLAGCEVDGDDPAARRRRRVAQRRRRGGDRLRSGYRRSPCRRRGLMLERIEEIRGEAAAAIEAADSSAELEELRVRYLGRKAELTTILRGIAELPPEERGEVGGAANKARKELEALLEAAPSGSTPASWSPGCVADRVDVTLPGAPPRPVGHAHLIARTTRLIEDTMVGLGYRVAGGPRDRARLLQLHGAQPPARATRRGCSRTPSTCSRTPRCCCAPTPRRCRCARWRRSRRRSSSIVPGKVYRRDSDATHSPMFHQIEGLAIAEGLTLADLKGTLLALLQGDLRRRARGAAAARTSSPSPSPASRSTSPASSATAPASLPAGERCNLCKGQGWIEILGAGMVDPNVLGFVEQHGYDPERVQGFAFGIGVERVAMLRHGVPDLRRFFDNDVRMLEQFG